MHSRSRSAFFRCSAFAKVSFSSLVSPREVIAADRNVALPDPGAVGDDQIGVVGPDVEQNDRILRPASLQLVEGDEL